MLILLEVLLTVVAWRKGWGPKALLPLAIGVPVGVFLAINAGSTVPAVVTDVVITIVLYSMTNKPPKPQTLAQPVQPAAAPDVPRQNAA